MIDFLQPVIKEATGNTTAEGIVKHLAGFIMPLEGEQHIDLGNNIIGILGLKADGLIPVVEGGVVLTLLGLVCRAGCIADGRVRKLLNQQVIMVEGLGIAS